VADDAGGWSLAPVTRPTHYVGRVGALAVALGVGGVIAGMPAVAMADTGTSDTATASDSVRGDASRAAGHTTTRPPTTRSPAAAHRRTSTTLGNAVQTDSDPATPIRRNRIQRSVHVARIGDAPTAPTDISPESEHDTTTVEPAVAQAPVVMSAAPLGELSGTDSARTNLLSNGTDPATPLATPLESMAAAATRRGRAAAQVAGGAVTPMALSVEGPLSWPDITSLWNDIVNGVVSATAGRVQDALNLVQAPFIALMTDVVESIGGPEAGSIANIVATSTFAVVNTLVLYNAGLASLAPLTPVIESLASNTSVLQFFSNAIAGSLTVLPDNVSAGIGNAAAYLLQQSLGNPTVAAALAPVFASATVPVGVTGTINFLYNFVASGFSIEQTLVQMIGLPVRNALSSFFANADARQALGLAATGAVNVLTGAVTPSWVTDGTSPALPEYIGEQVGGLLATALFGQNNPAGAEVAATVANAVTDLLSAFDDDLAAAVGSAVVTLLSQPGFDNVLATTALNLPLTLLGGTPLPVDGSISDAIGATVTGAVNSLLGNTDLTAAAGSTVTTLLAALADDPAVQTLITDRVSGFVTTALGGSPAATAIGAAVANAIGALLADPVVTGSLAAVPSSALTGFFSQTGVVTALADTVGQVTADILGGTTPGLALRTGLQSLGASPAIQNALGATVTTTVIALLGNDTLLSAVFGDAITPLIDDPVAVTEAVSALLVNNDLVSALGSTVSTLITTIADHPIVQAVIVDRVTQLVTTALGKNPAAPAIGTAAGNTIRDLLANSALTGAVGPLIGSTLTGFVGHPGVVSALAEAAGRIATDILGGTIPAEALRTALQSLQSNPDIGAAVTGIVTGVVGALASNTELAAALGGGASTFVTALTGNTALQTLLVDQVTTAVTAALGDNPAATSVGAAAGTAVRNLLTDPRIVGALGSVTRSVLIDFARQPAVSAAVADAAGQITAALMGGTKPVVALKSALQSLNANPDIRDAVSSATNRVVITLLSKTAVREQSGQLAGLLVTTLLSSASISFAPVNAIAGQVTQVAVTSLLGNPAVGHLISDVAVEILGGMPTAEVTNGALQSILRDPALHVALGTAIGDGVGSLFGANLLGFAVGKVVGATATLAIHIAAGIALLFTADTSIGAAAGTADAAPNISHFFEQITVASDLYVVNAIVPDWQNALAS